ncbi:hypothetical protein [Asticcacaulis machinosus]|uniref:Uncharacterized protein n=1 Tax=Asticcacaulis machinosus TaxID=2984211 RepID=A0ABT5HIA9_9CAUL|nr:hypothetical protein [Asticcacaulis machinosus]MDC7675981.1 hypothetical protein [Asticcacaulis machinosus]
MEEGNAVKILNFAMVAIILTVINGLVVYTELPKLWAGDQVFLKFAAEMPSFISVLGCSLGFINLTPIDRVKFLKPLIVASLIFYTLVVVVRFFYLTGTIEGLNWSYPVFLVALLFITWLVVMTKSKASKKAA